jgi:hypothetical protein
MCFCFYLPHGSWVYVALRFEFDEVAEKGGLCRLLNSDTTETRKTEASDLGTE